MIYESNKDISLCHNQKDLNPIEITHRKSASEYLSEITVNECDS